MSGAISDLRLQRLVEQVHALGPAPLLHLLRDIDRGADLVETLERYVRLPRDFIVAYNGDQFAPRMMAMQGGRRR